MDGMASKYFGEGRGRGGVGWFNVVILEFLYQSSQTILCLGISALNTR